MKLRGYSHTIYEKQLMQLKRPSFKGTVQHKPKLKAQFPAQNNANLQLAQLTDTLWQQS